VLYSGEENRIPVNGKRTNFRISPQKGSAELLIYQDKQSHSFQSKTAEKPIGFPAVLYFYHSLRFPKTARRDALPKNRSTVGLFYESLTF